KILENAKRTTTLHQATGSAYFAVSRTISTINNLILKLRKLGQAPQVTAKANACINAIDQYLSRRRQLAKEEEELAEKVRKFNDKIASFKQRLNTLLRNIKIEDIRAVERKNNEIIDRLRAQGTVKVLSTANKRSTVEAFQQLLASSQPYLLQKQWPASDEEQLVTALATFLTTTNDPAFNERGEMISSPEEAFSLLERTINNVASIPENTPELSPIPTLIKFITKQTVPTGN
ncbi:MAG: hypothetical protein D6820_03270, partial [Lentisphaerae bacterium]